MLRKVTANMDFSETGRTPFPRRDTTIDYEGIALLLSDRMSGAV